MEEDKLLEILKNPQFIANLVNSSSKKDFEELFKRYNLIISKQEVAAVYSMVNAIKKDILNEHKQLKNRELEDISGGKSKVMYYACKPLYYAGYGTGYSIGKVPILGYTVYHSIQDAIRGFYDSLHNY